MIAASLSSGKIFFIDGIANEPIPSEAWESPCFSRPLLGLSSKQGKEFIRSLKNAYNTFPSSDSKLKKYSTPPLALYLIFFNLRFENLKLKFFFCRPTSRHRIH